MQQKLAKTFLSAGFLGYSPLAPGTVASLAFLFLFYFLEKLIINLNIYLKFSLIFFIFNLVFFLSLKLIKNLQTEVYDHGWIVIDEFLGMLIACLPLFFLGLNNFWLFFSTFILFRILDILKPFGIKKIDQKNTPLSVLLDDIAAGLISAVILILIIFS